MVDPEIGCGWGRFLLFFIYSFHGLLEIQGARDKV